MKYYLLYSFAILLASCNSYSDESNICLKDLKSSNQQFYLENSFEISYIPLEYKNECPIINIDKAILTDKYIFIKSESSVYKFSITGDFLAKVGAFGQGPGEYLSVMDITINDTNKYVYIMDFAGKKIVIYNYESDYIGNIPYETWSSHIENADEQLLLSTMNTSGIEKDKLIVYDSNGKDLVRFNNDIKYELQDFYMYPDIKTIQKLNEEVIFRQPFNDTIYTYNTKNQLLEKRQIFDFGNLHLPYEFLASYDLFSSQYKNYCFIEDITESNDFLFISLSNCGKSEKYVVNKSKGNTSFKVDNNDMGFFVKDGNHYFWPKWLYSGKLISYLNADDLNQVKNKVINPNLSKIISYLKEDSNPVLVICKRK